MGGGPSREEREHSRRLEDLQRQQQQQTQQFLTVAQQEDPLESRLRQRSMDWLDWGEGRGADGTTQPLDVRRAPGLGPSLGLFDAARRGQQEERHGIGALRMGAQGTNSDLANLLTEQRSARREQDAAGQLEGAVATRQAEATGSALPLVNLAQNRRMGLAGLASGASQDTLGTMTQFVGRQRRRPFWQEMALAGWSQGASLASMGTGG